MKKIELKKKLKKDEMRMLNGKKEIEKEEWRKIGKGKIMEEKKMKQIEEKKEKQVEKIILRWKIEKGNIVIKKQIKNERIKENLDILELKMKGKEKDEIKKIEMEDGRIGKKKSVF